MRKSSKQNKTTELAIQCDNTLQQLEPKKRKLLEALTASLGIISTACAKAGISRPTYYRWMENDPVFAEAVNGLDDVCFEFVESRLYDLIAAGNVAATIFYMRTKGASRGYSEKVDVKQDHSFKIVWGDAD